MAQRIEIAPANTNLRFVYVEGEDTIAVVEKDSMIPTSLILVPEDSKLGDINTIVFKYLYQRAESVNA